MIIRRQMIGNRRLSEGKPKPTAKADYSAAAFLRGLESFCTTDLAGIVEFESFGCAPVGSIDISQSGAASLLKSIVIASGEDGIVRVAASSTADALLLMFRISCVLPELDALQEIRKTGEAAGFQISVSEGAIFAEIRVKPLDASLGAFSTGDFYSTLVSVFFD